MSAYYSIGASLTSPKLEKAIARRNGSDRCRGEMNEETMRIDMTPNPVLLQILKPHKKWSDRYTLLWQVFLLAIFVGAYLIMDFFGIEALQRSSVFILLVSMVLAALVWQAIGLGVARVHMLLEGIDPDTGTRRVE